MTFYPSTPICCHNSKAFWILNMLLPYFCSWRDLWMVTTISGTVFVVQYDATDDCGVLAMEGEKIMIFWCVYGNHCSAASNYVEGNSGLVLECSFRVQNVTGLTPVTITESLLSLGTAQCAADVRQLLTLICLGRSMSTNGGAICKPGVHYFTCPSFMYAYRCIICL